MILVKFDENYADEFDTQGFQIMTQSELDVFLAYARDSFIYRTATEPRYSKWRTDSTLEFYDNEVECYFGTNEQWRWSSYEDFMSTLEFQQISKYTAHTLEQLFSECRKWGYGMFSSGIGEY